MSKEIIYYCDLCAMGHKLPLSMGKVIGGYCGLCGYCSPFHGHTGRDKLEKKGITILSPKGLWKE